MTTKLNTFFSHNATRLAVALFAMFSIMTGNAQQREFTLEDLNFGGNNYHNMSPKNKYLAWWGDQLVELDVEECSAVDVRTGKENKLFTIDDINKWAETKDKKDKIHHLLYASFPYPDESLVQPTAATTSFTAKAYTATSSAYTKVRSGVPTERSSLSTAWIKAWCQIIR